MVKGGFQGGSVVDESACQARDIGSSLGGEDPLDEEMAIHSSFLAWEIPWTEEPGGLQYIGVEKTRLTD